MLRHRAPTWAGWKVSLRLKTPQGPAVYIFPPESAEHSEEQAIEAAKRQAEHPVMGVVETSQVWASGSLRD
jgi:hypothetical protein